MMKKYLLATTLMTALFIAAGCQKKPRVAEFAPTGPQVIQEATEEGTTRTQQGYQEATGEARRAAPGGVN